MNIFLLDYDVSTCAQYHMDRHVIKMILEYAQLLSTAHRVLDGVEERAYSSTGRLKKILRLEDGRDSILYNATHVNHPSAIWVRESDINYRWLHSLLDALCLEYTYRYGRIHATQSKGVVAALRDVPRNIINGPMSEFRLAMPDEFKVDSPVESYRNYYRLGKHNLHSWKGRKIPEWIA